MPNGFAVLDLLDVRCERPDNPYPLKELSPLFRSVGIAWMPPDDENSILYLGLKTLVVTLMLCIRSTRYARTSPVSVFTP